MINFSEFKIVGTKNKEKERSIVHEGRFVIGCDPCDQKDGFNTFHVYDKAYGKYIVKMVTKNTFDYFVNWVMSNQMINGMFTKSNTFVTPQGHAVRINDIRSKSLQGDSTICVQV